MTDFLNQAGIETKVVLNADGSLPTGPSSGGGGGGGPGTGVGVVISVLDSAGGQVAIDSLAQTLTYNGDGTVATIAATNGANTWTQTLGYTAGVCTSISRWVKS